MESILELLCVKYHAFHIVNTIHFCTPKFVSGTFNKSWCIKLETHYWWYVLCPLGSYKIALRRSMTYKPDVCLCHSAVWSTTLWRNWCNTDRSTRIFLCAFYRTKGTSRYFPAWRLECLYLSSILFGLQDKQWSGLKLSPTVCKGDSNVIGFSIAWRKNYILFMRST